MSNSNKSAFPFQEWDSRNDDGITPPFPAFPVSIGLTKRELFAAMVMQGWVVEGGKEETCEEMAHSSVRIADALLAELEKKK